MVKNLTTKQTYAIEYIQAVNKLYKLREKLGLDNINQIYYNLDHIEDTEWFRTFSKRHTLVDILNLLGEVREQTNLVLEDYYMMRARKTTVGQSIIAECQQKIEADLNTRLSDINFACSTVETAVPMYLGKEWGIRLSYDAATVGILNPKSTDKEFLFARTFSISYHPEKLFSGEQDKLYMNYGSDGEFCLSDYSSKIQFVSGMATFVETKQLQDILVEAFKTIRHIQYTFEHKRAQALKERESKLKEIADQLQESESNQD